MDQQFCKELLDLQKRRLENTRALLKALSVFTQQEEAFIFRLDSIAKLGKETSSAKSGTRAPNKTAKPPKNTGTKQMQKKAVYQSKPQSRNTLSTVTINLPNDDDDFEV